MIKEDKPEARKHSSKRTILIAGGIGLLMVLLAGAAFVGGRLMNGGGLTGITSNGPGLVLNGGGGGKNIRINGDDIQPAAELPQTPADTNGLFDHRQNNSIFVGTGRIMMTVNRSQSGQVETSSEHDGPTVEVVVSSQTEVYKDVTMQQFGGEPPQGQKIQQVVEPGSLDEIGEASMITVWGRKTGDRIIADVLLYSPPAFIMKAQPGGSK
jgi:hypothetical protein